MAYRFLRLSVFAFHMQLKSHLYNKLHWIDLKCHLIFGKRCRVALKITWLGLRDILSPGSLALPRHYIPHLIRLGLRWSLVKFLQVGYFSFLKHNWMNTINNVKIVQHAYGASNSIFYRNKKIKLSERWKIVTPKTLQHFRIAWCIYQLFSMELSTMAPILRDDNEITKNYHFILYSVCLKTQKLYLLQLAELVFWLYHLDYPLLYIWPLHFWSPWMRV